MRTEYVIVHAEIIERSAELHFPDSILALKRINGLGRFNPKKISEDEPANMIHPDLPAPADDLEVLVCGACRDICVQRQIEALTKLGYNARMYKEATITSGVDPLMRLYDFLIASYKLMREHYSSSSGSR